jgi:hypothetical protein
MARASFLDWVLGQVILPLAPTLAYLLQYKIYFPTPLLQLSSSPCRHSPSSQINSARASASIKVPYLDTHIHYLLRESKEKDGDLETLNRYNIVRLCLPPESKLMELDYGPYRYTYRFKPPRGPCQDDAIIKYIERTIRELNMEHIGFANMNFRVTPTNKSMSFLLALLDYNTYRSKLYTFMDVTTSTRLRLGSHCLHK